MSARVTIALLLVAAPAFGVTPFRRPPIGHAPPPPPSIDGERISALEEAERRDYEDMREREEYGAKKPVKPAAPGRTSDEYGLVGTIACDACQGMTPVAVLRHVATGKLVHLRPGDPLDLGGERTVMTVVAARSVVLRAPSGRTWRIEAGGFPEESATVEEGGPLLATKLAPPEGAVSMPPP